MINKVLLIVLAVVCLAACKSVGSVDKSTKEESHRVARAITVPYLPQLDGKKPAEVSDLLNRKGSVGRVDCLNWKSTFPYLPQVIFRIARSQTHLFIKYRVREEFPTALYVNDQEPVWKDSAVEFFCRVPGNSYYSNFEFNCIGTCLSEIHPNEGASYYRPKEEMPQILRYATLGKQPFGRRQDNSRWELTVAIPFTVLGVDPSHLPDKLYGNFFKCGDETARKHYVSWAPIATLTPSFHRPEFFGELLLSR